MKKYISILMLAGILLSCSDNFLDEKTYGLIRSSNYFTTVSDLEKCVNALYSNGISMYRQSACLVACMGGDDITTQSGGNKGGYLQFRYAEVLLVYAEAKAMSDGPDALAYTCINRVRARAGLENIPSGLNGTAFRDKVIEERKWEFAGLEPCARWFDMVRTETVESATAKRNAAEIPLVKTPTKDQYFAPIPQRDRIINPNL